MATIHRAIVVRYGVQIIDRRRSMHFHRPRHIVVHIEVAYWEPHIILLLLEIGHRRVQVHIKSENKQLKGKLKDAFQSLLDAYIG